MTVTVASFVAVAFSSQAKRAAEDLRQKVKEAEERGDEAAEELKRDLLEAQERVDDLKKSSVTISTQLDTLSQREAETLQAKQEADENIASLTEYVDELKSSLASSFESSSAALTDAQRMLDDERSKAAVLEAKTKSFEAKNAADEVMFVKLQKELSEQEEAHRVALSLQEGRENEKLSALQTRVEDDMKKAGDARKALEDEANGLSQKLSDLSEEFLDNENQGIVARKAFEKKVKGLLKEIEESKTKAGDLSSELEEHSASSSKAVKDLQVSVDKLRAELKAANYNTVQAESRLKQVEWLRSEEMKKYGFSGRTVKKKGKGGKSSSAGDRRREGSKDGVSGGSGRGGKAKRGVCASSGGGGGGKELMMLKAENERLKRSLYKAQQQSGKTSIVKSPSKGIAPAAPSPAAPEGPSKVKRVNEAKRDYQLAKEELKTVDSERKAVKEGVKVWLSNFEAENGYAASSDDKEEILDKYKKLKELEGRVKELKEVEKALKAKAKEVR